MNTTYIPNRSITLVTSDFRVLTGTKSTCDWSAVEAAVKSNDEQALINAISPKKAVEGFDKDLYFEGNNVFFKGNNFVVKMLTVSLNILPAVLRSLVWLSFWILKLVMSLKNPFLLCIVS